MIGLLNIILFLNVFLPQKDDVSKNLLPQYTIVQGTAVDCNFDWKVAFGVYEQIRNLTTNGMSAHNRGAR